MGSAVKGDQGGKGEGVQGGVERFDGELSEGDHSDSAEDDCVTVSNQSSLACI